jgi:hypothetical protein
MAVCPHQEFHTSVVIAIVVAARATETGVAVVTHIDRARRWETFAHREMRLSSLGSFQRDPRDISSAPCRQGCVRQVNGPVR